MSLSNEEKNTAYEKLTPQRKQLVDKVMENLEKGNLFWTQGWVSSGAPESAVTGKKYRGINNLFLSLIAMSENYEDNRWATFKQMEEKGWTFKKDEEGKSAAKGKGATVEYYKLVDGELVVEPDEARNIRKIFDLYLSGIGANAIVKYMQAHETGDMLWNIGRINYVLENERYTGNMIMGKTYTPNVLPLRNRPNKGQMDSFYYSDTHEGIITKEEFDKVKEIKKMRQKTFCRGAKEKALFSGKIKCRHCGWAYRPIVRNDKMLWSCSKKCLSIDVCHTPNRSNEQIERSFVSMYNKVRQNEKSLIDETIAQLQMLKVRINRGNDEIMQIDKDISVLSAQESLFTTLYSEGSFNEDLYFEKTDTIKKKISELKTRRAHLVSEDDDERCIERLRELKRNLQQFPVGITEFDKDIFNGIIKQIYIEESGAITFVLKGDLEFSAEV